MSSTACPPDRLVRWAALFHDMGKPACFFFGKNGVGHFYGHANVSVMIARGIMSRLKMSPAFASRVLTLVKHHDEVVEPTPRAVKRMLARLDGDVELFCALCDLKRGDARGQAPHCAGRIDAAYELEKVLADIQKANEAFTLQSLAINGRDVMALGIPHGRKSARPFRGRLMPSSMRRFPTRRVRSSTTFRSSAKFHTRTTAAKFAGLGYPFSL